MMAQRFTSGGSRRALDWGDDEAATRVRQDSACLSLVAGPGPLAARVFGSDGDPITIGRSSGCAVHLPLPEISRQHARIRYHAGRFWVEDLQTLNGTLVNQQLIERPMPLKAGDRLRIGDQEFEVRFELHIDRVVVHDSTNVIDAHTDRTEAQSLRPAGAAQSPPASAGSGSWVRVLTLSLLVVLPVATALAVFVLRTVQLRNPRVIVQSAPAVAPAAPPPVAPPLPAARPATVAEARVELEGAVALAISDDGTVVRALDRGSPVRTGDVVVRYRRSVEDKRRELERLNAKLEDDEDNAALARRARQLAAQLADEPPITQLKSGLDGVVVEAPAQGDRLRAGADVVRLARALRVVLDASAIEGTGGLCRVRLIDQSLELTGRRVAAGVEVTRFPAQLALDRLGRVRADCR